LCPRKTSTLVSFSPSKKWVIGSHRSSWDTSGALHRIFLTTICRFSGPAVYPPTSEPFWSVCLKLSWPWPSAQIASSRLSHRPWLRAPVRHLTIWNSCKASQIDVGTSHMSDNRHVRWYAKACWFNFHGNQQYVTTQQYRSQQYVTMQQYHRGHNYGKKLWLLLALVLLRSNVLLVTMEIKSTSLCIATDICRLSLMWEVPTV
jgi:hypothetical protein